VGETTGRAVGNGDGVPMIGGVDSDGVGFGVTLPVGAGDRPGIGLVVAAEAPGEGLPDGVARIWETLQPAAIRQPARMNACREVTMASFG
jgi:hypothetical protein